MKWTPEAEAAIKKVPFFVRKRVRAGVEKEAAAAHKNIVSIAEVRNAQARFLSNMAADIKGYQIDTCFGPGGCPNRAYFNDSLLERIEKLLQAEDLLGFLSQRIPGELKYHHEFRVTLADCPNACSQPQIKDIGIIGAHSLILTDETCTRCEACLEACKERAITLDDSAESPVFDHGLCVKCGLCVKACPTGTIGTGALGFRVQIGGKLGRHPQLARELPGIFSENEVLAIVKDCIDFYKQNGRSGQRFAEIFTHADFNNLVRRYAK
jgi:anaerobic sulfite reductase subunit C